VSFIKIEVLRYSYEKDLLLYIMMKFSYDTTYYITTGFSDFVHIGLNNSSTKYYFADITNFTCILLCHHKYLACITIPENQHIFDNGDIHSAYNIIVSGQGLICTYSAYMSFRKRIYGVVELSSI
jgi:hypothetical protein